LIFLYFSAYLTGIGALLERLNPPAPDVTTQLIADSFNATNFTLAANATIETTFANLPGEVSSVAVEVVYWVLLVFYALVPVAGCFLPGIVLLKPSVSAPDGAPDDPTEYAKWLEEQSKTNPFFTIIAPFEKKYAWCVPAWRVRIVFLDNSSNHLRTHRQQVQSFDSARSLHVRSLRRVNAER